MHLQSESIYNRQYEIGWWSWSDRLIGGLYSNVSWHYTHNEGQHGIATLSDCMFYIDPGIIGYQAYEMYVPYSSRIQYGGINTIQVHRTLGYGNLEIATW